MYFIVKIRIFLLYPNRLWNGDHIDTIAADSVNDLNCSSVKSRYLN